MYEVWFFDPKTHTNIFVIGLPFFSGAMASAREISRDFHTFAWISSETSGTTLAQYQNGERVSRW